mgnify:CR=1 FL=1
MSHYKPSKFINLLTTDQRLNNNEFNLKRKQNYLDEEEYSNSVFNTNMFNNNPRKYIKKDIILSEYNSNYYNPLLINEQCKIDSIERIERRLTLLHKNNYVHCDNYKKLNNNIKFLFRDNINKFNDLDTKIDLLNTKINKISSKLEEIDKEYVNITHKLCLKIDRFERKIDKIEKQLNK